MEAVTQCKEVSLPAQIPVDASEVHDALRALPAGKAGLPGTSPGAVWRLCADQVAPLIAEDLHSCWGRGAATLPRDWTIASLALIQKPGKQGTSPVDYRPIGLIDALGKASISMLMSKMRHDLVQFVLATPQFAYVPGRSTHDALRRVCFHNQQVQDLFQGNSRNPHMRKAGLRALPLAGGLQACLDMSSAFDLVPRSGLLEALHEAGVPEAPARLMLHWIERSTYRIRVEQFEAEVPSSRGVKQGCPASPPVAICSLHVSHYTQVGQQAGPGMGG